MLDTIRFVAKHFGSVTTRLLTQSQDSALAAIQVFNNPLMRFKSEAFIVMMNIAWTYLLHAHYRATGTEYRFHSTKGERRRFEKTADGSFRFWGLTDCLNSSKCPLDKETVANLRFLIGLRDEITHHMSPYLDQYVSARYQACCLNYSHYLTKLFGDRYSIDGHLQFSLQLQKISREQLTSPEEADLPPSVRSYIGNFDSQLSDDELNSQRFAYRMLFVPKLVGKRGQADEVIEFLRADSEIATRINREYLTFKEVERPKYRPGRIVKLMKEEGFRRFSISNHTDLWKQEDGKNLAFGYGTEVEGSWFWYETWVEKVRDYCTSRGDEFR